MKSKKYPNFFLVGAPRCGTTSLYEYLKNTNGVFMSPVKEPNFFSKSIIPDNYIFAPIRNEKQYLKLFSNIKDEIAIGEASTTYLQDPQAPKLIHEKVPNAKIIISLRDPVERAYSHFLYFQSFGFEKRSFHQAINDNIKGLDKTSGKDYVDAGNYSSQIQRYFNEFGSNQVKIILFNELQTNTRKTVKEILNFLNILSELPKEIDTIFNPYSNVRGKLSKSILQSTNITKLSRKLVPESIRITLREKVLTKKIVKPEILNSDKNFLEQFYEEDLKTLEKILNKKLDW